ncbi:hypothetical protein [Prescottella equi]|uniref:DUF8021 domain-containing protein n=2 Tax=Rhodococcus hoagii TaxID=43767 RepID=E9SXC9_RHOHA|nr:hypothetical protein [Prescottella equi]MBU4614908.1 hypothetical protein [Rhodococcus sp. GG48]MCD7052730.1 hypothetical protein [Rhodococcus sp. BH2-1]EGD25566.1 hypothetical protein HMPREF0724_10780 [Prescottella equi ATCC 33707]MBM4478041.1 hypothetical protein [Prescottella equi]MBM4479522.1 hypothetical protein [Prescottella equi]
MTAQLDAARTYVAALLSHDGDSVPYAPGAVRYEVGLKTGFSGNHLRRSLSRGPQFRVIRAIRDESYRVEGDRVIADYLIDAGLFGRTLVTARVHETFLIPADDPRIHRIEAKIGLVGR